MATNTAGDSARLFPWQVSHYIVRGGPNDPVLPSVSGGSNGVFGFNSALTLPPVPTTQTPPAVPSPRNMLIATGILIGTLPLGAWIVKVSLQVLTVFNGGTNALTIGTVNANTAYASLPGTLNNLMQSGDNTPGSLGVYTATRGEGLSICATVDQDVYVQYVQTGGAATTGVAAVMIEFTGLQG